MDNLQNKVAVVTGAASGMGLAFAHRFARAGMNVVMADIEQPPLDEAVSDVAEHGTDAAIERADTARAEREAARDRSTLFEAQGADANRSDAKIVEIRKTVSG